MRIGVFGGTFDPPHSGHLALAQAALEHLDLDEVLFMPVNRNPLKRRGDLSPGKDRVEMIRLMIQSHPQFAVSNLEITRGGPSYTVDTMTELQMAQPADYWFLLGADAMKGIQDWKQPERLLRLCRLGVVMRPPHTETLVLGRLPQEVRDRVDLIPMKPYDISSTELRDRMSKKKPTAPWLDPAVLQYINANKLYRI